MITTVQKAFETIETQKEIRQQKMKIPSVYICVGTGCVAKGALKVYAAFEKVIAQKKLDVSIGVKEDHAQHDPVRKTGCCGRCSSGVLVAILPQDYMYANVTVDDVEEIVESTLIQGKPIERLMMTDPCTGNKVERMEDAKLFKHQTFYIMEDVGKSECDHIEDYMGRGGYTSLAKVLSESTPQQVISMINEAGLRGRGGGGFSAGFKWEATRKSPGEKKFVVCNGDEGDPGAFMNRTLLERDPHCVLEGMVIAAYAVGAQKGYAYLRAEYPIAVRMFNKAIADAKQYGFLGERILGTDFSFDLEVKEGAGAFVCGEETALLASIEGKRGVPNPKPPYPAQSGLWGFPTLINNVETFANAPKIIRDGVEQYRKLGVKRSPGTKMFSVTGPLKLNGIIEVEFGTTLRHILYDICGGLSDGLELKAVQIGGPSGACLSEEFLDLPLDYDTLQSVDAMIGSGGIVAMTKDSCMVEVARYFLDFTKRESCGKCTPCREGTMQAFQILDAFTRGHGSYELLETLVSLSSIIKTASLCGLGKTAPNPILSTLKLFRDEYIAHIEGVCPSGMCTAFQKYVIIPDLCKGCSLCARVCPQEAIVGERGKPYAVDQEKCVKCGLCVEKCKFQAIELVR